MTKVEMKAVKVTAYGISLLITIFIAPSFIFGPFWMMWVALALGGSALCVFLWSLVVDILEDLEE
ncbi:MAG: hypothetical protein AAFR02_06920 [Pseudomonadota bacterium]